MLYMDVLFSVLIHNGGVIDDLNLHIGIGNDLCLYRFFICIGGT